MSRVLFFSFAGALLGQDILLILILIGLDHFHFLKDNKEKMKRLFLNDR